MIEVMRVKNGGGNGLGSILGTADWQLNVLNCLKPSSSAVDLCSISPPSIACQPHISPLLHFESVAERLLAPVHKDWQSPSSSVQTLMWFWMEVRTWQVCHPKTNYYVKIHIWRIGPSFVLFSYIYYNKRIENTVFCRFRRMLRIF